ncbi:hypothetical protein AB9M62_24500 [Bacillales bacterium AN1005]
MSSILAILEIGLLCVDQSPVGIDVELVNIDIDLAYQFFTEKKE